MGIKGHRPHLSHFGVGRSATGVGVILLFCVVFAAMFATGGPNVLEATYRWIVTVVFDNSGSQTFSAEYSALPFAVLGFVVGAIIGNRFLKGMERIGLRWESLEAGDKVTLFVGIFAGLFASVPIIQLFQNLSLDAVARVVVILGTVTGLAALSVYALQSMADILPWNRGRRSGRRSGVKILDTNVLIDGRVYDVAKAGFLEGQIYVPQFVLEELQYIADSSDALRRNRGRRGLEVLKHLQTDFEVEVGSQDRLAPDPDEEVDARIVRLAKALGADVVTNDFNLNRVASIQQVRVLSLNDLALALRTNVLPQETIGLKIIREGNQYGQGVGYLDDGTMVVVENGAHHIGEQVEVIVAQVIQTERGKMIFAEVEGEEAPRRRPARRVA